MWFPLSFVAESQSLDRQSLEVFASAHVDQYGIVDDGKGLEVSNWYVDDLVRDFKSWVQAPAELALTSAFQWDSDLP